MDVDAIPPTGACDVSTVGRRSGRTRRVEIWYVVGAGRLVLTGTPETRHWPGRHRDVEYRADLAAVATAWEHA